MTSLGRLAAVAGWRLFCHILKYFRNVQGVSERTSERRGGSSDEGGAVELCKRV